MFTVGDVVRKLRTARGWTLEDLGRRAHAHKMTISAIERGEPHTKEKINAIARALGCADGYALEQQLREWAADLVPVPTLTEEARQWLAILAALDSEPVLKTAYVGLGQKLAAKVGQQKQTHKRPRPKPDGLPTTQQLSEVQEGPRRRHR